MKTLKFGGTSMANAASIAGVKSIVLSDPEAKYVVVSAPGRRESSDTKVTDLLIKCYNSTDKKEKKEYFAAVCERFNAIIRELSVSIDFSAEFGEIEEKLPDVSYDFLVSRGEYFSAKLLAEYIGYDFIDAADFVMFNGKAFDPDSTDVIANRLLGRFLEGVVAPGFYGANGKGEIVAFSRGGSDISGAIVARATSSHVYENWTDVNGFMVCDPHIVNNPRIIDVLTYKELRELSYMGASVLHPESVFPVRTCDIPIHIRNTFEPSSPGTFIVPTQHLKKGLYTRSDRIITGIAGQKDFTAIFIEKQLMNGQIGFIKSLLDVLYRYKISLEHLPTGIDTVTLVIDSHGVSDEVLANVITDIERECKPNAIELTKGLALIAVVGHGMANSKGTAHRVCRALSNINIRMIDQGSSEINIIVAVQNDDYEEAVAALYHEFER